MRDQAIGTRTTPHLNDVFVIGAGASAPYGMPTGFDLIQMLRRSPPSLELQARIIPKLFGDRHTTSFHDHETLDQHPLYGPLSNAWAQQIQGSVILTIDQFLRNRKDPNLEKYGKALMAHRLLEYEKACILTAKDISKASLGRNDWIQYFLTQVDLMKNWEEYLKNSVFISFNYDRVLEYFMRQYLMMEHSKSQFEADLFVQDMRIYHLNGYLGPLQSLPFGNSPSAKPEQPWTVLWGETPSRIPEPDYVTISESMRTVWDSDTHAEQDSAKDAINAAKRIFVLGTSFIPENLETIGLVQQPRQDEYQMPPNRPNVWATALGLSEAQINRAALKMGVNHHVSKAQIRNVTCEDLVKDHVVL